MKNDNLKLNRIALATALGLLLGLGTTAFGYNPSNPLNHAVLVLRDCILKFDGDHAKRPFKEYIEDIMNIIKSNREYFINEIAEYAIKTNKPLPDNLTGEQFLDEFLTKLDSIKTCKKWGKIKDTLDKYTPYIPDVANTFEDTTNFFLLLGLQRRLRI